MRLTLEKIALSSDSQNPVGAESFILSRIVHTFNAIVFAWSPEAIFLYHMERTNSATFRRYANPMLIMC